MSAIQPYYTADGRYITDTDQLSGGSSGTQANYTTPSSQNIDAQIKSLRAQMQSGQMTPDQALQALNALIPAPTGQQQNPQGFAAYQSAISSAKSQLYQPMQINAGGRQAQLNPDGSISITSTQVDQTSVTKGGVKTQSTQQNVQPPTTNLQPGQTGNDVKQLQDYLVANGYMTQAQVNTGYGTYGPQTTAAVKAMQAKLGVNNSSGPGYYGPQTQAAIKSLPSSGSNGTPGTGGNTPTPTTGIGPSTESDDQLFSDAAATGITKDQWSKLSPSAKAILASVGKVNSTATSMGSTASLADALKQAANDPALIAKYADAAAVDKASFLNSITSTQSQLTQGMSDYQRKFQADQKQLSETAASNGQAFSGFRAQAKNNLASDENSIIESTRRTAQDNLNQLGLSFEAKYGSAALGGVNTNLIFGAPKTSGQDMNPNTNAPGGYSNALTYNPVGGLSGTQKYAQQSDINSLAEQIYNDSLNNTKVTQIG